MKRISQSFSVPFHYDILFTVGVFNLENSCFATAVNSSPGVDIPKVLIVIDQGMLAHHDRLVSDIKAYSEKFASHFQLVGDPMEIAGGEPVKNDVIALEAILSSIDKLGVDRHSYVVAIGGGAVLDTVGFASSVAHRGIRHIRIPTTVLSQNDSGVGVKNGVNFFGKKNFLGVFDPPHAVINDPTFLTTLDNRDWRAGVAESIKVALVKDPIFFESIEQDAEAIVKRSLDVMQEQIYRCAELHVEHIRGGDPFEKGSSRPLDFGHWAAHKLEQITDFRMRHGEAVAVGIALDTTYSYLAGHLSEIDYLRVIRLIDKLGFQLFVTELKNLHGQGNQQDSLMDGLEEFREHLGGKLTIMLIDRIGHGFEVHEMDPDLIVKAINHLEWLSTKDAITSDRLLHK